MLRCAPRLLAAALALALWGVARAELAPQAGSAGVSSRVIGGREDYAALPGDSLTSVGARFGLEVPLLARSNGLPSDARLQIGQVLHIERAHIVPAITDGSPLDAILINVPQRMLFLLRGGEVTLGHPIAAGRGSWRTPLGEFEIDEKALDKPWYVPRSIQEEMRRAGKPVLTVVPPGPENPLGRHWLGLSHSDCGIHSTNAPPSIYGLRTHGCIRQHPDDAAALFERVAIGERVLIVYEPVLLAALADGRVCLEAHRDPYGLAPRAADTLERLIESAQLEARVDRGQLEGVLNAREGAARDVTRGSNGGICW